MSALYTVANLSGSTVSVKPQLRTKSGSVRRAPVAPRRNRIVRSAISDPPPAPASTSSTKSWGLQVRSEKRVSRSRFSALFPGARAKKKTFHALTPKPPGALENARKRSTGA